MRGFSGQPLSDDDNYRIEKTQRNTIPERLHFSRERNMPIASIFGTRGYFVFSSEQSYDKFKQTNFNISTLDADGVGVPLFHIVQSYNVIGKITRSSPDFYIYKYVLQGCKIRLYTLIVKLFVKIKFFVYAKFYIVKFMLIKDF
ncbi:ANL_collapsed_G0053890.mRNA.1.CDS.1 [Saccharomyces cerevisiae]|nr:ANL_collapsed_G0053890.mRNA.1.CDS.1 [Saccharomyces cerevisiae]